LSLHSAAPFIMQRISAGEMGEGEEIGLRANCLCCLLGP